MKPANSKYRDDSLSPKQRMKKHGELGFGFEDVFEAMVSEAGHGITRGDTSNLRNADYIISLNVDAKARKTPFFKSKRFVGIEPEKCIVVDMDKIASYISEGRNTLLVCEIDYSPHFEKSGTYCITTNKIMELMGKYPDRLKVFKDYEKQKEIARFYISTDEMETFEKIKFLFE